MERPEMSDSAAMCEVSQSVIIKHSWLSEQDVGDNAEVHVGAEDDTYRQKRDLLETSADNRIIKADKPNEAQCRFEIQCKLGTGLLEVCICCNVTQFEVYDETEGYLLTRKGIPASNGLLFSTVSFKKPRTIISIKCIGITNQFQMKGILLRVEKITEPLSGYGLLNVSTLRDIILELGPETSERARSILNNIETYQKNQQNQIEDMSKNLAKNTSSTSNFDMSRVVSAFGQMLQNKDQPGVEENTSQTATFSALQNICSEVTNQRNQELLKNDPVDVSKMVEDRVSQAEIKILETVDDQLKQMEDRLGSKLDALLNTISTIKTNP